MRQATSPSALSSFDNLPDSAQVDARTVAGLFGCGVATVWRRASKGQLPKPRKFGVSARWNVGELRKALAGAEG
ncbi:MAG: helix-turn-helix transcriptional regulator [Cupriavidus necator]